VAEGADPASGAHSRAAASAIELHPSLEVMGAWIIERLARLAALRIPDSARDLA
jgi:hypothetical protein